METADAEFCDKNAEVAYIDIWDVMGMCCDAASRNLAYCLERLSRCNMICVSMSAALIQAGIADLQLVNVSYSE